jgi:hypothetical protein
VFAPVTEVIESAEDPTAVHPEIQRQVAHVRTDLDGFSPLEISSLVQHGYCVARRACRARPDVFGAELPADKPWDPFPQGRRSESLPPAAAPQSPVTTATKRPRLDPTPAATQARTLQSSALRRIWSHLLDYRDWSSYVYVPIIVPILVLTPYFLVKAYQRSHRENRVVQSLSQSTNDLTQMRQLLEGPIAPFTTVEPTEEVGTLEALDLTGFEVLQELHILDLRNWNPASSGKSEAGSMLYSYRRLKVFKKVEQPRNQIFRLPLLATSPLTQVRFPAQQLQGRLRKCNVTTSSPEQQQCHWEVDFDFERLPAGEYVDLIVEGMSPGQYLRRGDISTTLSFDVAIETAEMTRWILLPKGREYRNFRLIQYKTGKPDKIEPVRIVNEYLADDYTILAYKLLSVDPGYTHEVTWYYK